MLLQIFSENLPGKFSFGWTTNSDNNSREYSLQKMNRWLDPCASPDEKYIQRKRTWDTIHTSVRIPQSCTVNTDAVLVSYSSALATFIRLWRASNASWAFSGRPCFINRDQKKICQRWHWPFYYLRVTPTEYFFSRNTFFAEKK